MSRTLAISVFALIATLCMPALSLADASVEVVFSKDEVSIIASWYRDHGTSSNQKKKGKNKGGLPPGIAKNLQRGKPLPPGIAKQHLPDGLVHELPAPHPGYDRIIVDGKILLVEVATRIIHDILTDAILH